MLGLYIHIPFCTNKCPYCDFYSTSESTPQQLDYAGLLIKHLEVWRQQQAELPSFDTIFFGGGTPSLLPPEEIAAILNTAERLFGISPTAEISMEANPGTVTFESLKGYRESGVNRISFGVQSLQDSELKTLGRNHSRQEAIDAILCAREIGFDSVGADIIFALPGQSTDQHLDSLHQLLKLNPDHISAYGLTIEEGTPFARTFSDHSKLPDDEIFREMFLASSQLLSDHSYNHYEISNYARQGKECRHNLLYWQRHPYIGIGPGAHSFLGDSWGTRLSVEPNIDNFVSTLAKGENPSQFIESFTKDEALRESIYLALRTNKGLPINETFKRFAIDPTDHFAKAIDLHRSFFLHNDDHLQLSLEGWLIYDHIISDFLVP